MKKFKLDFTNVQDFELMKEGNHLLKVTSVDEWVSNNNNESLKIEFQNKEKIRHVEFFPTDGKAIFKLRILLSACGFDVKGDFFEFEPQKIVGKKFYATIVKNFYNNEDKGVKLDLRSFKPIKVAPLEPEIDLTNDEDLPF